MKNLLLSIVFVAAGLIAQAQEGFYFTHFESQGASHNTSFDMSSPESGGYGDYTDQEVIINPNNVDPTNLAFTVAYNEDANINMWVDLQSMGLGWLRVVDTTGQYASPFTGTSELLSLLGLAPDGSFTLRIGGSAGTDFPADNDFEPTPDPDNANWEFIDITITIDSEYDGGDMSVGQAEFQNFVFYPNPVKGELNIKAGTTIQKVSLYNMLGQQVKTVNPQNNRAVLNTASLQSGVYLMKVDLNGHQKTYRIIKE